MRLDLWWHRFNDGSEDLSLQGSIASQDRSLQLEGQKSGPADVGIVKVLERDIEVIQRRTMYL